MKNIIKEIPESEMKIISNISKEYQRLIEDLSLEKKCQIHRESKKYRKLS